MKILTILGARPQFIKAGAVSRILKIEEVEEIILHTGQHFDDKMSDVFFKDLEIPKPDINLNINSLSHGAMTGRMMEGIENEIKKHSPDIVMVYGDTNSTIAGALAAKKLHVKVAHVEAGLRSFNMKMPEEVNRILTDRISDFLFCPTETAVKNLAKEGFKNFNCRVDNVGDVMYDAVMHYKNKAIKPSVDLPDDFILLTIHRAENTDNKKRMQSIFQALNEICETTNIVCPLHPRTKKILEKSNIKIHNNLKIIDPVGYFEILFLLNNCKMVMTDSGGLQKEAYFFKKLCITLRDETEWTELTEKGFNYLAGANKEKIISLYNNLKDKDIVFSDSIYGDGNASGKILKIIEEDKL